MLLGARTAAWSGVKPTARDYDVSRGMIILYDGIESRDWGTAVTGGNTWYNLCGYSTLADSRWVGNETVYLLNKWESGGSDYTTSGYSQRFQVGGFNSGGSKINDFILLNNWTFSATYSVPQPSTRLFNTYSTAGNKNVFDFKYTHSNGKLTSISLGIGGTVTTVSDIDISLDFFTIDIVRDGDSCVLYLNGDFVSNVPFPSSLLTTSYFYLTDFSGLNYCYAWRCRTVSLTANEVAKYYAIDRKRFLT